MNMKGIQRLCSCCGNEGYLAANTALGTVAIQACDLCGRFENDIAAGCHALQRNAMGDGFAKKELAKCSHPRTNEA